MAEAAEAPRGGSRGRGRGGRGRGFAQKRSADYDYEDYGCGYSKKRKIMDDVYRFLVKEPLVRAVIGKGGEHIRAIKDEAKEAGIETKVSIYAQSSNGVPLMDGAMDRVMGVQTTMDGLAMALEHLVPTVQIHSQGAGGRGGRGRGGRGGGGAGERRQKLELRLLVPAHCCSAIIGKGGSVIKKIKEETKSYIQVYTLPMPLSEEHCVRIQNFEQPDLITTAIRVFEYIADIKGKNPITMYDPIYFEFGEYGDTGSYIDSGWYQQAIRAGTAVPTPFKEIRAGGYGGGGGYEQDYGYGGGYGGYSEPAYEESYYAPPPRARAAPRGVPRGRGAPRARGGFPPRGGAPRGYPPRGAPRGYGPPRGAPRGSGFPPFQARGRGGYVKQEPGYVKQEPEEIDYVKQIE